jgi:hypothetical protein
MNHWTFWAACRGEDPELFFSDDRDDHNAAKTICRSCPVLAECRADAFATDLSIPYGIRGGLSANERRRTRREDIPTLAKTERDEAISTTRTLTEHGVPAHEIAARLGVNIRTVVRWRRDYLAAA